jgi:NAD-dependent SIR2 family protein deacetylase
MKRIKCEECDGKIIRRKILFKEVYSEKTFDEINKIAKLKCLKL